MYLHNTNEAHSLYNSWFKTTVGLHGLEMTFLYRIEPTSLTLYEIFIIMDEHTTSSFLFTLPFGPTFQK